MKEKFSEKHPFRASIILAIITVIFPILSGVISVVYELNETQILVAQSIAMGLSAILGLFLMKRSTYSWKEYGFCSINDNTKEKVLWFIPMIAVEVLPFVAGFAKGISITQYIVLLIFCIIVGIDEEVFYRGLMLKILSIKGIKKAIIWSSVIFGIAHASNALSGTNLLYVILQVCFAALFGFACGEIVVITKSLIPVILWHLGHDFIANITSDSLNKTTLIILAVQTGIILVYTVYLWKHVKEQ